METSSPIKICLIGAGQRAQKSYIPVLKHSNKYQLTVVCDANKQLLSQLSADLPTTKMITSVETLLINGDLNVDFAIVCVPHQHHFWLTQLLLENGISVLKEKPFAIHFAEALTLKSKTNENSKVGVVVQNRFDDFYLHCKKLRNALGTVKSVFARSSLHIKKLDDGWRATKLAAGGGVLTDVGYHMMDFLLMLFGEPDEIKSNLINGSRPNQVYDCEDTIQMLIKWSTSNADKSITSGIVEITRVGINKEFSVQIRGTNGYLIINNQEALLYDIDSNLIEQTRSLLSKDAVTEKVLDQFYSYISHEKKENIFFDDYLKRDLLLIKIINSIYKDGTYSSDTIMATSTANE